MTQERRDKQLAELRRDVARQRKGYRARALAIYPHICASCGREFSGPRLKELTVHHRDHDHDNNPPDGSNWELLCLYCHDHEHEKLRDAKYGGGGGSAKAEDSRFASPFEGLDSLVNGSQEDQGPE